MLDQITRSKPVALTIATLLTLVVAVLDYVAGPEMILAAYYTFPILLAAWTCGFRWGVAFSLVAYLIIIVTAANVGHPFSQPSYFWFDTTNILLVFLVVAFLAARLRQSWDALDALARTDPLTGILNRKAFQDAVEAEINRQARSHLPFTLFHIDCDNFKEVNDTRGHKEGDKVLIAVAQTLAASLRKSDIVARLGGDEFGVMLTAANAPESLVVARGLLDKVRAAMAAGGWPVSVSIGVAVYTKPPASALAAIDEADRIMYEVKQTGKNDLMQRVVA